MIKAEFAHVAEKAILDKRTNQLSLINVISAFGAVGFPFVVPECSFVMRTTRDIDTDPKSVEMDIIIKQQRNLLLQSKFKINYDDKKHNNTVIHIVGLVIQEPTPIEIICKKDNKQIAKLKIPIEQMTPEAKQQKTT